MFFLFKAFSLQLSNLDQQKSTGFPRRNPRRCNHRGFSFPSVTWEEPSLRPMCDDWGEPNWHHLGSFRGTCNYINYAVLLVSGLWLIIAESDALCIYIYIYLSVWYIQVITVSWLNHGHICEKVSVFQYSHNPTMGLSQNHLTKFALRSIFVKHFTSIFLSQFFLKTFFFARVK